MCARRAMSVCRGLRNARARFATHRDRDRAPHAPSRPPPSRCCRLVNHSRFPCCTGEYELDVTKLSTIKAARSAARLGPKAASHGALAAASAAGGESGSRAQRRKMRRLSSGYSSSSLREAANPV